MRTDAQRALDAIVADSRWNRARDWLGRRRRDLLKCALDRGLRTTLRGVGDAAALVVPEKPPEFRLELGRQFGADLERRDRPRGRLRIALERREKERLRLSNRRNE
jgi:hypothetical protein